MEMHHLETLALHGGQTPDPVTHAMATPIYQTTSYVFDNTEHAARLFNLEEFGNIYTRIMNPTTDVLEKRIAMMEGGVAALATSSGQAAITLAVMNIAEAGDEIVASTTLYGGTYTLFRYTLAKMGVKVHFVDASDPENFRKAITPKTKLLYMESVGNPKMDVPDMKAVSEIAHANGLPLVVDNTFCTPHLFKPMDQGADIVVHSATKYIGGHGTSIGGIIVDSGRFAWNQGRHPMITEPDPGYHNLSFWKTFGNFQPLGGANIAYILKARVQWLRDVGSAMSPFNAWLFLQGMETLHLRMERHSENALKIARFLESHPKVDWVLYPGLESHPDHNRARKFFYRGLFGGMMGFGIKGGMDAGKKFINSLKLFSHVANVGDARSLAIHPASTTHSQLSDAEKVASGVTNDFIRLSIGIENHTDLERDLDQALNKT